MTTSTTSPHASPTGVGLGVLSEALIPGGSNLIKGDLKQGVLHLLMGVAAGAVFGPLGVLAVRANSLAKASTGKSMLEDALD